MWVKSCLTGLCLTMHVEGHQHGAAYGYPIPPSAYALRPGYTATVGSPVAQHGSKSGRSNPKQKQSAAAELLREALVAFIESIQVQLKSEPDAIPKALAKGIAIGGNNMQVKVATA